MATLTSGDTLSLNGLGTATGQSVKSLSAAKGNTTGPIAMSSFAIDSFDAITGYTYAVENTTEFYTASFSGEGSNFGRIANTPANFTWTASGGYISLQTNYGYYAEFLVADMNPQSPSAQEVLQTVQANSVCCTFADSFNHHATNYNVQLCKTVYSVDSYDGNATALCLPTDSLIRLSDGTEIEAGDLLEGNELIGVSLNGLSPDNENFYDWSVPTLNATEQIVTVKNLTYSFADKFYSVNDGEVIATAEHPMLVYDVNDERYRFKEIFKLNVGDELIRFIDGGMEKVIIKSIDIVKQTDEIISIDVEEHDTYLVNDYITHNKGGNTHTDLTAPDAPTGLTYSAPNLTWNAVTGADTYELQVDNTSSSFTSLVINTDTGGFTSWDVSALSGTHWARVRAVDHGLVGDWSTTLEFTV